MSTAAKKPTTKKATAKATASNENEGGSIVKPKAPARDKPAANAPTTPVSGSAPAAMTVNPSVIDRPVPMIVGPDIRKKEIIEEVVLRTGLKKRDVKPVIDSLLAVMGEALSEGREMVLPPFGRLKAHKQKTTLKKKIFFAKVHQNVMPAMGPSTSKPDSDI